MYLNVEYLLNSQIHNTKRAMIFALFVLWICDELVFIKWKLLNIRTEISKIQNKNLQ